MLDFGDILINNAPEATTVFLKSFCTDPKFQVTSIDSLYPTPGSIHKARPQDYLHLFLNKSEYLVEFLEHLIQTQTGWSTQIYNALVEHYLVRRNFCFLFLIYMLLAKFNFSAFY